MIIHLFILSSAVQIYEFSYIPFKIKTSCEHVSADEMYQRRKKTNKNQMEREFLFVAFSFVCVFRCYVFFLSCLPYRVSFATLTFNKLDQILNSDFTEQEIKEFEQQWEVPVLRIANVTGRRLADGRSLDGRAGVMVGYNVILETNDLEKLFTFLFYKTNRTVASGKTCEKTNHAKNVFLSRNSMRSTRYSMDPTGASIL